MAAAGPPFVFADRPVECLAFYFGGQSERKRFSTRYIKCENDQKNNDSNGPLGAIGKSLYTPAQSFLIR